MTHCTVVHHLDAMMGVPNPSAGLHMTPLPRGETCRHSIFDQSGQRLEFAIPSLLIEGPGQMNLGPQLRGFGINFCGNAVIGASSRELAAGCESLLEGRAQSGWLKGHNLEPGGGNGQLSCRSYGNGNVSSVRMTPLLKLSPSGEMEGWSGIELHYGGGSLCTPLPTPSDLPAWVAAAPIHSSSLVAESNSGGQKEKPSTATFALHCDPHAEEPRLSALELGHCDAVANFTWRAACPQLAPPIEPQHAASGLGDSLIEFLMLGVTNVSAMTVAVTVGSVLFAASYLFSGQRRRRGGKTGAAARRRERQQKQASEQTTWDMLALKCEWSCGTQTPLADMISQLSEASNVRDFAAVCSGLSVILVAFAVCAGSGYCLADWLMVHRAGTLLIVPGSRH